MPQIPFSCSRRRCPCTKCTKNVPCPRKKVSVVLDENDSFITGKKMYVYDGMSDCQVNAISGRSESGAKRGGRMTLRSDERFSGKPSLSSPFGGSVHWPGVSSLNENSYRVIGEQLTLGKNSVEDIPELERIPSPRDPIDKRPRRHRRRH